MMKKILSVFCLLLVVISASFASDFQIGIMVSPYQIQRIKFENKNEEPYLSQYGFGTKEDFEYKTDYGLTLGVDLSVSDFIYSGKIATNYWVISLIPKVGLIWPLSEKFAMDTDIGVGVDFRLWNNAYSFYPSVIAYVGCKYDINQEISIKAGIEGKLAWQKSTIDANSSLDSALKPLIGIGFGL